MRKSSKHPESEICKNLWTWFQLQYPKYKDRYLRFEVRQTSKIQQAILKAEGNKRGTSDVLIAIPTESKFGLWLEVKTNKGRLSESQKSFQAEMEPQYATGVGYGFDECKAIIMRHMANVGQQPRFLQL